MSTCIYETKDFLKLRKEWYAKLEQEGFEDIEFIDWRTGESGNLLNGMSQMDMLKHYSPEQERYYELARQWYHTLMLPSRAFEEEKQGGGFRAYRGVHPAVVGTPWDIETVRAVWALHMEGHSMRAVERQLHISRARAMEMCRHQEALMFQAAGLTPGKSVSSPLEEDTEDDPACL